jgi:hypothetical protein
MPTKTTIQKAKKTAKEGKQPTTQAGEFIREEMHKMKNGSGSVRSRKQAIAVGLSEARRAGVKLSAPSSGSSASTREKAAEDTAVGSGKIKVSETRSAGAKKAARTRERLYAHSH